MNRPDTDGPDEDRAAPATEQHFARLLAVVVDEDRGESPFGWSPLPPSNTATRRTR
ncbi:hypothetical protein [Streptomyces sp. NPDC053560]|uniref:hypothetical protein n=1 Tax=Streptomyces sp. NPDC053560 TaxID=3365711 RepID=UPI0037CFACF5